MNIKLLFLTIIITQCLFAQTNMHITSDSVELDGNANEFIASGNVVVTQKGVTLKSKYVTYNQLSQIAKLSGTVTLIKENLTLSCNSAVAYGLENIIEANGEISVEFESVKANAEHAYFDVENQLITLTGNPIAFQSGGYIKGTSIVVDLENIKVTTVGEAEVKLNLDEI
jgi:lipopolysaccharide export system protein LptA